MPKGSPIRLYYNVKCLAAEVKNENLHYWIQLHADCSKIKWDKSKRLLPGNLVLLMRNSATFDSVIFATVGQRNDDELKENRKLSVILEPLQSCNVDVLRKETDLMLIESEVYWESFRYKQNVHIPVNRNFANQFAIHSQTRSENCTESESEHISAGQIHCQRVHRS